MDAILKVDPKTVESIVSAEISNAVVLALGGYDDLIKGIVAMALNQKVDSNGKPSNYSSDRPYLEWLVRDTIQDAAKEALKKYLVEQHEKLEKEIYEYLSSPKQSKTLAAIIVNGIAEAARGSWRLSVDINLPSVDTY